MAGGGFQGGTLHVLGDILSNTWDGGMGQRQRSIIQQWAQVPQPPQGLEQEPLKARWLRQLPNKKSRCGAGSIKETTHSYQ